jgi:hypothetical protein
MTKEEFRRRLMTSKQGSAEDSLVDTCIKIQIEFNELDAEKLLEMPSTRFDLLIEKMIERNKKAKEGNKQKEEVDVFGLH